jgi:hypothetical protein
MRLERSASAFLAAGVLEVLLVSAAAADEFPTVVTEILTGQMQGPISEMQGAHKEAMIDCVNTTLVELPKGRKRFILEGASYQEREQRFGMVLYENRAEWVQKIAGACASIAMSGGYSAEVPASPSR